MGARGGRTSRTKKKKRLPSEIGEAIVKKGTKKERHESRITSQRLQRWDLEKKKYLKNGHRGGVGKAMIPSKKKEGEGFATSLRWYEQCPDKRRSFIGSATLMKKRLPWKKEDLTKAASRIEKNSKQKTQKRVTVSIYQRSVEGRDRKSTREGAEWRKKKKEKRMAKKRATQKESSGKKVGIGNEGV